MATWKVQQKIEMWKETTIEAKTYQEAIEKSWDYSTEWEILTQDWEDTEEFWLENQKTGKCLTVSPDGVFDGN
jgi:hypothetical protein